MKLDKIIVISTEPDREDFEGPWLPEYDEWKQPIQVIPKYFY